MNISGVLTAVKSAVKTGATVAGKWCGVHAPELCLGAGIATIAYGTVEIAKAHRDFDKRNDERLDAIVDFKEDYAEEHDCSNTEVPTPELVKVYIKEDAKLASAYIPGIVWMGIGVVLVVESHNIMRNRLAAAATYANGILALFNEYRARVREDQGEEKDREYLTGAKEIPYSYDGTTSTGKPRKMHGSVTALNPDGESLYMRILDKHDNRFFDEYQDWEISLASFEAMKNLGKRKLITEGFLCMDDIYRMFDLSLEDFPEAKVTGYIYDPNWDETHDSPQFDFHVYDERPKFPDPKAMYVNADSLVGNVWIEFLNADGYILDKIESLGFRGKSATN